MIQGIGVDMVEIERIEQALEKHGEAFVKRVLTEPETYEWLESSQRAHFLAKRWAAKEAFGKACGTGMRSPVLFHNLWVVHGPQGNPRIEVAPQLFTWLEARGISRWHLSLSDERSYAMAFVVMESKA